MNTLLGRVAGGRTAFRNGLYWCTCGNGALHPRVQELSQQVATNFRHVTIDGFDELLAEFDFVLRDVDHFGKGWEAPSPEPAPDELPVPGADIGEIDLDLALATLSRWAQRLERGGVTSENYEALMLELRLAANIDNKLVPTLGGLLLFGRNPQKRYPHAFVRPSSAIPNR